MRCFVIIRYFVPTVCILFLFKLKWAKNKSFYASIRLCLVEFCFSLFVVSSGQFEWNKTVPRGSVMSRFISLSKLFFYKSSPLNNSKFHVFWRLTANKKLVGYIFGYSSVSGLQSFPPLATRLWGFRPSLSRPKSKKNIYVWSLSFAWTISSAWCFMKAQ